MQHNSSEKLTSCRSVLFQMPWGVIDLTHSGQDRVSHLQQAGSIVVNPEPLVLVVRSVCVSGVEPRVLCNEGRKLQLGQKILEKVNDDISIVLSARHVK